MNTRFEELNLGLSSRATGVATHGERVAAASYGGEVVAWDGKLTTSVMTGGAGQSMGVAFSPSGKHLGVVQFPDEGEPVVVVFDAKTFREQKRVPFEPEDAHRDTPSFVWLDEQRVALAVDESRAVTVVDLEARETTRLKGAKLVYPLAASATLLLAGGQKQVQAWALPSLKPTKLERPANRSPIDCCLVSGQTVASLSESDLVIGDRQYKSPTKSPGSWAGSRARGGLHLTADGKRAIVSAWHRVLVIDLATSTIAETLEGHEGKDFTHLVACGKDLLAFEMGGAVLRWRSIL